MQSVLCKVIHSFIHCLARDAEQRSFHSTVSTPDQQASFSAVVRARTPSLGDTRLKSHSSILG